MSTGVAVNIRWRVILHGKAFSDLRRTVTFAFEEAAEAKYLYDALVRAGEKTELQEESVQWVTKK